MLEHFSIRKKTHLDELSAVLIEGVHAPSGAQFMHIANDDPENLFCLSFRTLPGDDKGAAHILEHTVLCGSKKFPIKDPFFSMHRRSLNTFMNAMTGSDFTCYPAASQVKKDFYNLFEVYLDAVFHPTLNQYSFLQEGHRLEIEGESLVNKGIVFNEMKGALANPDSRIWDSVCKHLLPDTPYRYNSGGIPEAIAELTYQELLAFHKTYYHPSRCLFFTYGNIPLEEHLAFIEKQALKGVEKLPEIAPIVTQKRFLKPLHIEEHIPAAADEEDKDVLTLSWLTVPIEEQETALALAVLDSVLMDTDASLLKRHILDSKLCTSVDAYLDLEMRDIPYLIICRDVQKKSDLESIILDGLKRIAKQGVDPKLARSALHQLELSRLEITGGHSPFGLTLFMRSALMKQHGCNPENALSIYSIFEQLRSAVENPHFLGGLIQRYLLDNLHRVTISFKGDPSLIQKEESAEKKRLEILAKKMTIAEKNRLKEQQQSLGQFQKKSQNESLDCLPKITLQDIPKNIRLFPLEKQKGKVVTYHHEAFTNHLIYANASLELPALTEEELIITELMTTLLPDLGLAEMSFSDHLAFQHAYTGGFSLYFALNTIYGKKGTFSPRIHLKGKALACHQDKLSTLFQALLEGKSRFDERERIRELVIQMATALKSRLVKNAMSYAIGLSLAPFSKTNTLHEKLHGIAYYQYIQQLAKDIDTRLPLLQQTFAMLKNTLFHNHQIDLVLTGAADECTFNLQQLPKDHFIPFEANYPLLNKQSHARKIPSNVAFTSKAMKLEALPSLDAAALSLACRLFENKVLHQRIREEGGAYGSGASYHPLTGNFHMHAYRDPNLLRSIQAFDEAIEVIGSGAFSADDLLDAKLGLIQSMDAPIPPGSRGIHAYSMMCTERTPERRQAFREQVLGMEKTHIEQAIQSHLKGFSQQAHLVTFAGEELLEKEQFSLDRKRI